jgi:hypothetical protein
MEASAHQRLNTTTCCDVSHRPTMLRAAFLSCALILPALFASATAGQLEFGFENLVANNMQIPLNHSYDYQSVCHGISRSISPASQVFFPGAVLFFYFTLEPLPMACLIP